MHLSSCQSKEAVRVYKTTTLTCSSSSISLHPDGSTSHQATKPNQPCTWARTTRAIPCSSFASSWGVAKPSRTTPRSSCSRMWARRLRCRRFRATWPWTVHGTAGEERPTRRTTEAVSEGASRRMLSCDDYMETVGWVILLYFYYLSFIKFSLIFWCYFIIWVYLNDVKQSIIIISEYYLSLSQLL